MHRERKPSSRRMVACIVCKAEFYTTHSQGKYCSEICRRKGWRKSWVEYNERNKVKRLAYGRRRYYETKERRSHQINTYRKTPAGKIAQKNTDRNNQRKFPEKITARSAVSSALYHGKIRRKPCEVCGILKVEAHHDDYSKPLDVKWLCNKHHKEYEKKAVKK